MSANRKPKEALIVLSNYHWTVENYSQRMTTKQ